DVKAAEHRLEDQDLYTDEDSNLVNFIPVNKFIATLRANGVDCKISQTEPQTCGLWCVRPGYEQLQYQFITSMQVPVMPEWTLIDEDRHGLIRNEAAIGWRQVLVQLVMHRILTESQAHQIFGEPKNEERAARYRKSLYAIRNGRVPDEYRK